MSAQTLFITQQFRRQGRKLMPAQTLQFRSARDAVARCDRDAVRMAGVVAFTQTVDDESGEVLEEPAVLARHGELPAEFREDD